jgi:hypothetical protein
MLDTITIDTFAPRLGEIFRILVEDRRGIVVKLTGVTRHGAGAPEGGMRVPFTLAFHTLPDDVIPQGTYRVEHDEMPPMDLFVVPMEPDERGMRYEAVFG